MESLSIKEWAGLVTATLAAVLLGLKQALRMRSEFRADHAEGSAENVAARTIASLTKENDRLSAVIVSLSEKLTKAEDRITVEMEARRNAVHDALDSAQATLAAGHKLEGAQVSLDSQKERIAALERELMDLRLKVIQSQL